MVNLAPRFKPFRPSNKFISVGNIYIYICIFYLKTFKVLKHLL